MGRAAPLALGAIGLWASVAALGVALADVPPLLLTGASLLVGSVVALPMAWSGGRFDARRLVAPRGAFATGVGGLFGYHFLLFVALRFAPPVEANLVNYLWPLLIVVLAPLVVPGARLRARHVVAAVVGFGGAALAILGGAGGDGAGVDAAKAIAAGRAAPGYLAALGAAVTWALYSLATQRQRAVPTTALGSVLACSGLLALAGHALLEPAFAPSTREVLLLVVMGLGPLGLAFFLWDAALKRGEAATIGLLSFITPVLSTTALVLTRGEAPGLHVVAAAVVIVSAALLGTRDRARARAAPRAESRPPSEC